MLQGIPENYARVWAQIDLDAAVENMENMKANIAQDTRMIAVIKTDGYGHGAPQLAGVLENLDYLWGYAVATFEEGRILRQCGSKKPILVLGYTFPYCYKYLGSEEIRPAVFREDMLEELNHAAMDNGKKIKVHVKVDTGMGRIGIRPDESGLDFVKKLLEYPGLELEGIFTHFAKADEYDKAHVNSQIDKYFQFVTLIEESLGIKIPMKHCSNSAGILEIPRANADVVRAGITLYGLYPSEEVSKDAVSIRPVLSLYSHIAYIKTVYPGETISYGGTFRAEKEMKVATIPVGYGDGYPRGLSGKGYVKICGKKAPILGRVCMDQFMVDVTDIPEAKMGDTVVLIGDGITAEILGELSGRFNYELVCDLGKRIPRVYLRAGKVTAVRDYYQDYR